MSLILAEKLSVGRTLSSVVGANKTNKGCIEGCGSPVATSERNLRLEVPTEPTGENGYIVSWCVGHLVGLKKTNEYGCGWEQKTGNVLFKFTNDHGKTVGAEKFGTFTEHKSKGVATGSAGGYGFEVRCTLPKSKKDRLRIYRKDGLPIYHHMFIQLTRRTEQPFSRSINNSFGFSCYGILKV